MASVVIGALAFGITLFGFASARDIMLSSVCAFGVGVCVVEYQTQNQTLLQLLAPREMRGRVMSIFSWTVAWCRSGRSWPVSSPSTLAVPWRCRS